MPSLAHLMVDVNSLVPNLYTPTPDIKETNIKEMKGDLEPQKRMRGNETGKYRRRRGERHYTDL